MRVLDVVHVIAPNDVTHPRPRYVDSCAVSQHLQNMMDLVVLQDVVTGMEEWKYLFPVRPDITNFLPTYGS